MGFLLFGIWSLFVSCGEQEKEEAPPNGTEDTEIPDETEPPGSQDCDLLSVDECTTRNDCFVIEGKEYPYDDDNECYNEGEKLGVGCMDASLDCGAMETWAADGNGNCMLFPSTCIPKDWSICDTLTSSEMCGDEACENLQVDTCAGREDCTVLSAIDLDINTDAECFISGENMEVGCLDIDIMCGSAITFASPTQNITDTMMFFDTCIPNGWTTFNDLNSYGECDDSQITNSLEECVPAHNDPLEITALSITADTLTISIGYSGGCEDHEFELCWSGSLMETAPVSATIEVGHNANTDVCEAYLFENLVYDIGNLREAYNQMYGQSGEISLKVGNQSITYVF